jgi:hypothetical protein
MKQPRKYSSCRKEDSGQSKPAKHYRTLAVFFEHFAVTVGFIRPDIAETVSTGGVLVIGYSIPQRAHNGKALSRR